FFFSSRRRHTRSYGDWSSDVCSSDLASEHGWSAALYDASSGGVWQSRRYQVHVVDRVGGGDSFAAALIAALAADRDPADAVQFRSEERRVGKECRCRWSPAQYKRRAR